MFKKIIVFNLCLLIFACAEDKSKIVYIEDLTTLKNTSSGQVIGFNHKFNSLAWYGIPYAKPPVNELRWRAPQPIENDKEIIKATSFSDICFQNRSFVDYSEEKENYVGSEDCLYLNIHSPRNLAEDESLPVMVWIHGGGNTTGAGSAYDFSRLASEQKVIVITINYRLGPFGWFYHPSLIETTDSKEDKSGNFGLLDQILALKWVKKNIKEFGGNPDNVTIFGESAGGHNVFSLISSNLASGLFHRAISQSGSTRTTSVEDASNYADDELNPGWPTSSREIVNNLLIRNNDAKDAYEAKILQDSMNNSNLKDFLQSLSSSEILDTYQEKIVAGMFNVPRIIADGYVLPKQGMEFRRGQFNKVPTMLGTNRDEMKLFFALDEEFVTSFSNFIIFVKDKEKYEIENEYASNNWKISGVDQPARKLVKSGNLDVFAYRFDWDEEPTYLWMDFSKIFGAAHGFEIPFVSGSLEFFGFERFIINDKSRPAARELSNSMMSYWAEFAYTGNPGSGRQKDLEKWQPWQNGPGKDKFIVLDSSNDKGIYMSKSELFYDDELQRLAVDTRIGDIKTKCTYINNLKESGNKSNFALEECEKL